MLLPGVVLMVTACELGPPPQDSEGLEADADTDSDADSDTDTDIVCEEVPPQDLEASQDAESGGWGQSGAIES